MQNCGLPFVSVTWIVDCLIAICFAYGFSQLRGCHLVNVSVEKLCVMGDEEDSDGGGDYRCFKRAGGSTLSSLGRSESAARKSHYSHSRERQRGERVRSRSRHARRSRSPSRERRGVDRSTGSSGGRQAPAWQPRQRDSSRGGVYYNSADYRYNQPTGEERRRWLQEHGGKGGVVLMDQQRGGSSLAVPVPAAGAPAADRVTTSSPSMPNTNPSLKSVVAAVLKVTPKKVIQSPVSSSAKPPNSHDKALQSAATPLVKVSSGPTLIHAPPPPPNFPVQAPMVVAIIGHSMVHDVWKRAVMQGSVLNAGVPGALATWQVKRGMNWAWFKEAVLPNLCVAEPRVVYIQLVDNDLDSIMGLEVIRDAYVSQARALVASGVEIVILSMALHRHPSKGFKCPSMTQESYSERINSFNSMMRQSLLVNPDRPVKGPVGQERYTIPRVWWWEHQRLRSDPPASVSGDGVHLSQAGTDRLYKSIRNAVWDATDAIRFHL